jgi:hypothetical protein
MNGPESARAVLHDYRSAARFASDDAEVEIRIAILFEALGKRRDADRAIARAERIDRRLAETISSVSPDAGGFLAAPPEGVPAIAIRGFQILDELAAGTAGSVPSPEPAPQQLPVLAWLSEAWARRWGPSAASAMPWAP